MACDGEECSFIIASVIERSKHDGQFDLPKFQSQLKLTPEIIEKIAQQTVGQRDNAMWQKMRMGRITASNFHAVISAVARNRLALIRHNEKLY